MDPFKPFLAHRAQRSLLEAAPKPPDRPRDGRRPGRFFGRRHVSSDGAHLQRQVIVIFSTVWRSEDGPRFDWNWIDANIPFPWKLFLKTPLSLIACGSAPRDWRHTWVDRRGGGNLRGAPLQFLHLLQIMNGPTLVFKEFFVQYVDGFRDNLNCLRPTTKNKILSPYSWLNFPFKGKKKTLRFRGSFFTFFLAWHSIHSWSSRSQLFMRNFSCWENSSWWPWTNFFKPETFIIKWTV